MPPQADIPIAAKIRGPGPAAYILPSTFGNVDPTLNHEPVYGFGQKHKDQKNTNPGPRYDVNGQLTRRGRTGHLTMTFKGRHSPTKNPHAELPGPGQYNPVKPMGRTTTTTCTIKGPIKYKLDNKLPPPNAYRVPGYIGTDNPSIKNGPSYALKGSNTTYNYAWDYSKTVGPAGYAGTDSNVIKQRSGQYTIKSRVSLPRDRSVKPGPGAYNVHQVNYDNIKKSAPKFSMGCRHSQYVMPLITQVDM